MVRETKKEVFESNRYNQLCKHSCNEPSKKSEFRVFNQFTEFKTLNELAHDVQTASKKIGVKVSVKKIKNPRKEMEDHYYNPKNTSLISLGLKPIRFSEKIILENLKLVHKYKKRINKNYFLPTVKWEK